MSSLVDAPPPASPGRQGGHTLPSPITISFYHDVLTCHRPGVKWPFEVPETVSQNEPFLFLVVFFRYFVTVLQSLSNTMSLFYKEKYIPKVK